MRRPDLVVVVLVVLSVACGGRSRLRAPGGPAGGPMSFGNGTGTGGDTGRRDPIIVLPSGGAGSSTNTGGAAGASISAGGAGGATRAPDAASAAGTGGCGAKIDDMEDGTGHICLGDGRDGVWYAYCSQVGTQWPALTSPGIPIETSSIPGGRGQSRRAMHTYGSPGLYAGIGLDFGFDGTTYRTYDASAYNGITFWARGKGQILVRVSTAATTATQWGGTCDPGVPNTGVGCQPRQFSCDLRDEWVQHWVPFAQLALSWQTNPAGAFDRTKLTNLQFEARGPDFDFWIDDISFYVGAPGCVYPPPAGCEGTVQFADPQLRSALTVGDFAYETVCYTQSIWAGSSSIQDLQGLQCLLGLNRIDLVGNRVTDLSPLSALTMLSTLYMSRNQVTSLEPLRNLTGLTDLDFSNNPFSDVSPLSGLKQLQRLDLSGTQVKVVSGLYALTALGDLNLAGNEVADVFPLRTLVGLRWLDLSDNRIQDIAGLSGLSQMGTLKLSGNQIEAISHPFVLEQLAELDLSHNLLRDVTGLGDLTKLVNLNLSNNNLTRIDTLAKLTSLVTVDLSGNAIVDVSPLAGLPELSNLNLKGNQIADVAPLLSLSVFNRDVYWASINLSDNPRIDCTKQAANIEALRKKKLSLTIDCP